MIINWAKKDAGLLTVSKVIDNKIVKTLFLLPGHNEIDDADWEGIKGQLLDKIKDGTIIPIEVETKKSIEVNGKEKTKKITTTKFSEFPANKALEIVEDTFDINVLKKWKAKESRDEIRAAIAQQIELVKDPKKQKEKD